MTIRAVFFDLGGTLFSYAAVRRHFGEALASVADEHALDVGRDELRAAYQASVLTVMAEYKDRDYYLHRDLFADAHERMLERLGVEPGTGSASPIAAGPEGLLVSIEPRPGTRETLERLRGAGLHLSIVSNIDEDQFEAIFPPLGLADCFDAITTSEGARSCKPHGRIFEVALEKAGVAAAEVAFVGDSILHDVAGANAAGMRSIWLSDAAPAEDAPTPHHVIADLRELPDLLLG